MCAVDIISGDQGAVKGAAAVRFCERQRCGSNPVQLRFSERDTQLPRFSRDNLKEMLSPLLEYYPKRDRGIITNRVIECILERQKQH